MLAALPSGERFINKNSKKVKKTGNANKPNQTFVFKKTVLEIRTITEKIKDNAIVKIIAGIKVATVTKYENQLSLPIK